HITFTCTVNIFQHITFTCIVTIFQHITFTCTIICTVTIIFSAGRFALTKLEALGTEDRNSMAETEIDEGDGNAVPSPIDDIGASSSAVPYSPIDISDKFIVM
ncbi:hypothetical protein ACJX0J_012751, partial [Zea mays]